MNEDKFEFKNEELEEHKIDYTKLKNEKLDDSEILVYELNKTILNIYKLCFEEMGYDLGKQFVNDIDYVNYLENESLNWGDDYIFNLEDRGSDIGDFSLGLDPGELSDVGISEGMIQFISTFESGRKFGYQMSNKDLYGINLRDANGHRTFGYGLLINPITKKYMDELKPSYTQEELEQLYKYTIKKKSEYVDKWAAKRNVTLNQDQKDAIVSAIFNFGEGFLNWSIGKRIAANPNDTNIKNIWAHWSDKQGINNPGLIKRRHAEANWYFGTYI